jgi:hypothetical protein
MENIENVSVDNQIKHLSFTGNPQRCEGYNANQKGASVLAL